MGHLNELSTFALYTLWWVFSRRRIKFLSLILNHMFLCQNPQKACLPYVRLLISLFFRAWKNRIRHITSAFPPKTYDHNAIFHKLVLRENTKRMTKQALTFRASPEDDVEDAFWDNIDIQEDKPRGEESACWEKSAQTPHYHLWEAFDAIRERVDQLTLGIKEMRMNQEVHI